MKYSQNVMEAKAKAPANKLFFHSRLRCSR